MALPSVSVQENMNERNVEAEDSVVLESVQESVEEPVKDLVVEPAVVQQEPVELVAPAVEEPTPTVEPTETQTAEPTEPKEEPTETIPELRQRKPNQYSKVFSKQKQEAEIVYECNICLDQASLPIVTLCGHLYCWECISQWTLTNNQNSNSCPVCKSGLSREKMIPIYVRGGSSKDNKDPRNSRPKGIRTEPERNFIPNIQFGMFPFPNVQFTNVQFTNLQGNDNEFVSRMFLMMATLVLVSIILY